METGIDFIGVRFEVIERGIGGGETEGIAVESAGVHDFTARDEVHVFPAASDGA